MEMEKEKHTRRRRTGSREVPSRFLSPASPPPHSSASAGVGASVSPLRRKSSPDSGPKARPGTALRGGVWPSSSSSASKKPSTLADHLRNDRLIDLADRTTAAATTSRQRSCSSEFQRFENADPEIKPRRSKENRPIISGSAHYIGNEKKPSSPLPSPTLTNGRISLRRQSDSGIDFLTAKSDRSDSSNNKGRTTRGFNPRTTRSPEMNPAARTGAGIIGRGSPGPAWLLSPDRRPGALKGSPVAEKGRGVGNFITLGLDLFRRKSFSGGGAASSYPCISIPPSSAAASSPKRGRVAVVVGETGHQLRVMHNRLIQWRFVHARSNAVDRVKIAKVEVSLVNAWARISKLQASVASKRVQLEKEKLGRKLKIVLSSQLQRLEGWRELEGQHLSALSTTKDCLQSAVCRVPLIEGAKVDAHPLSSAIREANDIASAVESTINICNPMAQHTAPLLSELAQVVTKERSLVEECFEMMSQFSTLQIQEQSLKCHLIQQRSIQQQQNLELRPILVTR